MEYDIIFVSGEVYVDHPLCGTAILKRVLEEQGFSVAVIEMPTKEEHVTRYGKPRLFFGVSSGSIDSMVRNYTPLKRLRKDDMNLEYGEDVPDRATTVFCNWIKKNYKDSILVIGGTEATLRRFTHYDYWQNRLRRSIMFDTRADIMVYGSSEKQIVEVAERLKKSKKTDNFKLDNKIINQKVLEGIKGTCIISRELPEDFVELPSHELVAESNDQSLQKSKENFCKMQLMLTNNKNLAQKLEKRYILQYKMPIYTTKDLDYYYSLPYAREIIKHMRGFQFSVVTHRGCIGSCNFCSLKLTQGDKIISRSEKAILEEMKHILKHPKFKGKIDDLTGPSVNMYGMDCDGCDDKVGFVSVSGKSNTDEKYRRNCLDCKRLDRSNKKLISLLRKARDVSGIFKINIKSGIRYDLASRELIEELTRYHIFETLRIAPEHVNKDVLNLMNKNRGNLKKFIDDFKIITNDASLSMLSYYFITAHPGSSMKEANELSRKIETLRNAEHVQVFTPTPMTMSTCMYYTAMDPKTKKKIHVPYTYLEKKQQKRVIMD
jgi:uncharacterized radical SAM protein YgiQ